MNGEHEYSTYGAGKQSSWILCRRNNGAFRRSISGFNMGAFDKRWISARRIPQMSHVRSRNRRYNAHGKWPRYIGTADVMQDESSPMAMGQATLDQGESKRAGLSG